jgi:hypothetical protein
MKLLKLVILMDEFWRITQPRCIYLGLAAPAATQSHLLYPFRRLCLQNMHFHMYASKGGKQRGVGTKITISDDLT